MKKSNLTPSEAVIAYVAKHDKPNPEVLPNPAVYYTGKSKGKEWFKMYFPVTGEIIEVDPSNYTGWRARLGMRRTPDGNYAKSTSTPLVCSYIDYDPEFEVLEFGAAYIPNKRPNRSLEKDIREWEFAKNVRYNQYCTINFDRYFLVKSTGKTVYNERGQVQSSDYVGQYGQRCPKFSHYINECGSYYQTGAKKTLNSVFAEFNGTSKYYGIRGAVCELVNFYQLRDWYMRTQKERKEGKVQKLIDELAPLIKTPENYSGDAFYYEKLNKEWNAFLLVKHKTTNRMGIEVIVPNSLNITYAIFFNEKGEIHYAEKRKERWINSSPILNSYSIKNVQNIEEGIKNSDRLKWIKNSGVFDADEKIKIDKIILCLKRPELENLYKLGYKNIANYYLRQPISAFEKNLGKVSKGGNFYKQLGFSKAQLEYIESKYLNYSRDHSYYRTDKYTPSRGVEAMLKSCLGTNDLSSYQLSQVVDWIDLLNEVFNSYHSTTVKEALIKTFDSLPEKRKLLALNRLAKIQEAPTIVNTYGNYTERRGKFYATANLLRDSCCMLAKFDDETFSEVVNNLVHFDKIENKSDLQRFHDNVVGLYNAKMLEIEMRKNKEKDARMKKIDEKRKEKYEMEGDEFIIRLPISVGEISIEGSTLHHCVGGYVDRHASGQTTILFLRKKSAPDTPFYTIEVRESDIIQIHGFGNKWLGNDPEAIPFVAKWVKERKLCCQYSLLLSTSTHYGNYDSQMLDAKKYGIDW